MILLVNFIIFLETYKISPFFFTIKKKCVSKGLFPLTLLTMYHTSFLDFAFKLVSKYFLQVTQNIKEATGSFSFYLERSINYVVLSILCLSQLNNKQISVTSFPLISSQMHYCISISNNFIVSIISIHHLHQGFSTLAVSTFGMLFLCGGAVPFIINYLEALLLPTH